MLDPCAPKPAAVAAAVIAAGAIYEAVATDPDKVPYKFTTLSEVIRFPLPSYKFPDEETCTKFCHEAEIYCVNKLDIDIRVSFVINIYMIKNWYYENGGILTLPID